MKRTILFVFFFSVLAVMLSLIYSGCSNDKIELTRAEELCDDTTAVSYQQHIKPIIQRNCLDRGCHCTGCPNNDGFPITALWDRYDRLRAYALEGLVLKKVKGELIPRMPKNYPPLSKCDIGKLERWIQAGAPNN